MNIVNIINDPPIIVFKLGCSLITNQTQNGPKVVSSIKNSSTSYAGMYLGAKVSKARGIVTKNMHMNGIIYKSDPFK